MPIIDSLLCKCIILFMFYYLAVSMHMNTMSAPHQRFTDQFPPISTSLYTNKRTRNVCAAVLKKINHPIRVSLSLSLTNLQHRLSARERLGF